LDKKGIAQISVNSLQLNSDLKPEGVTPSYTPKMFAEDQRERHCHQFAVQSQRGGSVNAATD